MTDIVALIHGYNFFLICAAALISGVWGLIIYFSKREPLKPWYISLYIVAALGLLQGLLGVMLVLLGQKPGGGVDLYWLHYVYGGIVVFALPVAVTYTTNGKNKRRDTLIYSLAVLILAAASVRGWMTGPIPGHFLIPFIGS